MAQYRDKNKMSAANLGVVFGPTIFTADDPLRSISNIQRYNALIASFIEHYGELFDDVVPEANGDEDQAAAEGENGGDDAGAAEMLGTVVAISDYEGGMDGETYCLPFRDGDVMEQVRPMGDDGNWLWGYHPVHGEWGCIPKNHVEISNASVA